jgi:very-short-patch-repair endonuclease
VGNALYGMQGMSSDSAEVRAMLLALVPKVESCRAALGAQAVGNSLYGMQKMSSDSTEMRAMLLALAPKVESCREALGAQALGNALFGMQKMSSDSAEVRAILLALVPRVESCREALGAQELGNALYGMQGMSSDSAEVRAMLLALVPRVESCRAALGAQAVGNALYGMQGMSSDSAEVRAMLLALVPKVESCREALGAQELGNALYGMQGMLEEDEYLTLLDFLYDKTKSIAGNALSCEQLISFAQPLALTFPKLRTVSKDRYEKWENISSIINNEILECKNNFDAFFGPGNFRSAPEQRVYDIAQKSFEITFLSVSSNEHLFNLFESDIVLRVPIGDSLTCFQSNDRDLIINIEIDGIHHKQERRKRFCMLRDDYLKSRGVIIERIETSTLRRMKDREVKEWVQERVIIAQRNQVDCSVDNIVRI